jgi:hypothetical protein
VLIEWLTGKAKWKHKLILCQALYKQGRSIDYPVARSTLEDELLVEVSDTHNTWVKI